MKQFTTQIIEKNVLFPKLERNKARTILNGQIIWLHCPEIAKHAKPGQFVMVKCGKQTLLQRPFSIHQVEDKNIALLIAVYENGEGTQWLSERSVGEHLEVIGPLGNGFSIQKGSKNLLLVAGGIGVAPLYFLAQKAIHLQCSVTMLLGASNEDQLFPEHLIPSAVKLFTIVANRSETKRQGMVLELLEEHIEEADQVFSCGPVPMYKDMCGKEKLQGKSVQVSLEVRMGCGLGYCYACTIKTRQGLKQVCKDGPVFELNDVVWNELL